MTFKAVTLAVATAIGVAFSSGAAQASLIGTQATVKYMFPDLGTVYSQDTVTIGAGSEITCPGVFNLCGVQVTFDVDFVADSVTVRIGEDDIVTADFNGFLFDNLDFGPNTVLAGVSLDTNIVGLTDAQVAFGDDFVSINWAGLSSTGNSFFALNFTTRDVVVQTPAPGILALFGLTLAGLGLVRRRRP